MAKKQISMANNGNLRIVSLIPSASEIVAALGYGDRLVGRSHECDYPAFIKQLPICTEPKFDPIGTSEQIHQRVTELLASALSVYRVKTDVLAALNPTHIITQAQCEVCAVSLSDVEKAVTELVSSAENSSPIKVVSLQPNQLADIWTDIATVAAALGMPAEVAHQAIAHLQSRLPATATQPHTTQPKVACIEWTEPLMAAGNWVPELVALAGGIDCLGTAGAHSAWMSWDALTAAAPDIIIVLPCGYDLTQTRQATAEMATHYQWNELNAVKQGNVYLADGNQYFNRPGPRLVESCDILIEIIQGKPPNPARATAGWEKW
ncbi:MAG: cobalamin-binding protein [Phormidesmis sp.]